MSVDELEGLTIDPVGEPIEFDMSIGTALVLRGDVELSAAESCQCRCLLLPDPCVGDTGFCGE